MIMTFDNTVAAESFITLMRERNAARAEKKGRAKWKLAYVDGSPADYIRVKHS